MQSPENGKGHPKTPGPFGKDNFGTEDCVPTKATIKNGIMYATTPCATVIVRKQRSGPTKERFTNCACDPGRDNLRLVPSMYREATTPPRPHHIGREEKWAMRDDGPPMSTTPRHPPQPLLPPRFWQSHHPFAGPDIIFGEPSARHLKRVSDLREAAGHRAFIEWLEIV